MNRLGAILLATVILASRTAGAEERAWIGAAVGLQNLSRPMLGDAPEIVDGLGLSHDGRTAVSLVPQVSVGHDLHDGRGLTVGLDLTVSWFRDAIDASSTTGIRYRVRRDVIPVTAFLRLAFGEGSTRFLLAGGPTVAVSRFDEKGWLGDGTETKPALGGALRLGGRTEASHDLHLSYFAFMQVLHLPQGNVLVADGGTTWMGGASIGIDFGF